MFWTGSQVVFIVSAPIDSACAGRKGRDFGDYENYEEEGSAEDEEEIIKCAACNRSTQQPDIQVTCVNIALQRFGPTLSPLSPQLLAPTLPLLALQNASFALTGQHFLMLCYLYWRRCSCSAAATTLARCGTRSAGTGICPR